MSFESQQLARLLAMADVTAKKSIRKDVHSRAKRGECLQCKKHENNRRGLCNACYLRFRRAQQDEPRSKWIEFEQRNVREGQILASGEILEIVNPNPFKRAAS